MRDQYLQAMGITRWVRREPDPVAVVPQIEDTPIQIEPVAEPLEQAMELSAVQTPDSHNVDGLGWSELETTVSICKACDLYSTRTQTVFGSGDNNADWLIIGEAPGADEESEGQPFVGPAGQLLTSMIEAMGMTREQVYIANILKCRPPQNRDPDAEEVMACQSYLRRQIELLQPKMILAVGRVAAQNLLNTDDTMKAMRGQAYTYADTQIPLVVTYHPAYLLRSPLEKRKAWQDLQMAMRIFDGEALQ